MKDFVVPEMPRSIAAIAAQHLEKEIIEGRLQPGSRLIEEVWAERFGISRGSFREVLRILESSKLVEITPRKGAQVATLNRKDVEEIYLLRKNLFKLGYSYAAGRMTEEDLSELQSIFAQMAQAVEQGDPVKFTRQSHAFDEKVLDVSSVIRLRMVIDFLGKQTLRYRYIGFKLPGQIERSLRAHQEILDAFIRRDGEAAGNLVYEIIERAGNKILELSFSGPAEKTNTDSLKK